MVNRKVKEKLPTNKDQITIQKTNYLDPNDYNVINYAYAFRNIDKKPLWLGRDWASLRAFQMFCHHDPSACSKDIDNHCNKCGHNKSDNCGIAWKYRNVAVRKSAQSGWSEFSITFAFWATDVLRWNTGYYFPSMDDLRKWGYARIVNPLKTDTRFTEISDATTDKMVFNENSFLYLFGLNTRPKSYALNMAIIDELAEVENMSYAAGVDARLQGKKWDQRFRLDISTPVIEGRDISAKFDAGTRHRWHIPCTNCGSIEQVSYLTHINREKEILECSNCGHEINRLSDGVYLPDRKDETMILSIQGEATFCSPISIKEMILQEKSEYLEDRISFYIHKLGVPYTVQGSEITEGMIKKSHRYTIGDEEIAGEKIRTAGVDVGNEYFDIRISDQVEGKKYFVVSCTLPYPADNMNHGDIAWNELGKFLFDVMACDFVVVDNMPKQKEARRFAIKYPGKVYRCAFYDNKVEPVFKASSTPKGKRNSANKDINKSFMVYMDRTTLLNEVQSQISQSRIVYPKDFFGNKRQGYWYPNAVEDYTRYISHMTNVSRRNIPKPTKESGVLLYNEYIPAWVNKNAAKGDHQFLAEGYDTLAGMAIKKKLVLHPITRNKNTSLNIEKVKEIYTNAKSDKLISELGMDRIIYE